MMDLHKQIFIFLLTMTIIACWLFIVDNIYRDSNRLISRLSDVAQKNESRTLNSSSISMLNEQRWIRIKEKFRFISTNIWLDSHVKMMKSNKTLIFSCQSFCGGFGDRLRGIISTYFLALLTGRRFMIDMNKPCDLMKFLLPNHYNWTLEMQSNQSSLRIYAIDKYHLLNVYKNTLFYLDWNKYDRIEIAGNMDMITSLFSNPFLLNSSSIMKVILEEIPLEDANINSLFPLFYETLFQPSQKVKDEIDRLLKYFNRQENHFICLHARVGKNPSNPHDESIADSKNLTEEMIEHLDQMNRFKTKIPIIFVSSDSSEVILKILEHFPLRSLSVRGPILHIDRWSYRKGEELCQGFLRVIVEFYLFGECQTSFISQSGYSAFANRRRINPYENLYLYRSDVKRMFSCQNLFSIRKWEPSQSILTKVFCPQ